MVLEDLRTVQARALYANYTITMVAIGIHIFMAIYGLFVFLEMSEQLRNGRRRYIVISFVITCLSAFAASLDMASYFQVLFNSTSPSHWRELLVTSFSNWKPLTSNTVLGIVVWIGDVFLVYRCYVICTDYRWVAVFPGAMSVSALVVFFLLWYGYDPDRAVKYESVYTLLTVSNNMFVTCLIAFRVLRARRTLSKLMPMKDVRLYTGVVAILIESALPLSIFGIITAGLLLARENSTAQPTEGLMICYNTFIGLFYLFCTLSPHMIIFRVTTGRSLPNYPSTTNDLIFEPIEFAHPTTESSLPLSPLDLREINRNSKIDVEQPGEDTAHAIPVPPATGQISGASIGKALKF